MLEQSSLVRLKSEFDVEVQWRGFELHPETPIGGMAVAQLFRGRSIEEIRNHMSRFGAEFGVEIVVPEHLSNTRRALAMSEYARDHDLLESFREEAMRAYWLKEGDLEDEEELGGIAARSGLDEKAALQASLSRLYIDRVLQTREDGIDRMVTGVPTIFMNGMPVVGCQRYETIEKVAQSAGATRR